MRITCKIIIEERVENKEKKVWLMKAKNCKQLKEVEVTIIYIFYTRPLAYITTCKVLFDFTQTSLISGEVDNGKTYGSLCIHMNFNCECESCS